MNYIIASHPSNFSSAFASLFSGAGVKRLFNRIGYAFIEGLKGLVFGAILGLVLAAIYGGRVVYWPAATGGVGFKAIFLVPVVLGACGFLVKFVDALFNYTE